VLQDTIDKLIEIGRCYGMEMNVEKTEVMRISRQPLPVKIMIDLYGAEIWTLRAVDQKHLESFEMWCWKMEKISWTDHVRN
jgi:hypothetical protein